jgi:hypothetical protein
MAKKTRQNAIRVTSELFELGRKMMSNRGAENVSEHVRGLILLDAAHYSPELLAGHDLPRWITKDKRFGAKGASQVAENMVAVATAAKSTTQGANDTQTAAGELARMAPVCKRSFPVSSLTIAQHPPDLSVPARRRNRPTMRIWRAGRRLNPRSPLGCSKVTG